MRSTILAAAIALLPAAALAQNAPALNLQANAAVPTSHVKTQVRISYGRSAQDALEQGGQLAFTLVGDPSDQLTQPVLVHVVGVDVPELSAAQEEISVSMTVDQRGVPSNIRINHPTGTDLDARTIAAVSQYRFKPATVNHLPATTDVTVQITLSRR